MLSALRKMDRLGQWDGRRHSSRRDEPLYKRLGRRAVLIRLAVVFSTTMFVAAVSLWWGLPFPYREAQTWPHDVKARCAFDIGDAAGSREATRVARGDVIVAQGQPIQRRQLDLLRAEHLAHANQLSSNDLAARTVAQ